MPLQDYLVKLLKEWSYTSDVNYFLITVPEDSYRSIGVNLCYCPGTFIKDCRFQFLFVLNFILDQNSLAYLVIKIFPALVFIKICFGYDILSVLEELIPINGTCYR